VGLSSSEKKVLSLGPKKRNGQPPVPLFYFESPRHAEPRKGASLFSRLCARTHCGKHRTKRKAEVQSPVTRVKNTNRFVTHSYFTFLVFVKMCESVFFLAFQVFVCYTFKQLHQRCWNGRQSYFRHSTLRQSFWYRLWKGTVR